MPTHWKVFRDLAENPINSSFLGFAEQLELDGKGAQAQLIRTSLRLRDDLTPSERSILEVPDSLDDDTRRRLHEERDLAQRQFIASLGPEIEAIVQGEPHRITFDRGVIRDLDLSGTTITSLPEGLQISGKLDLTDTTTLLPMDLQVIGDLNLKGVKLTRESALAILDDMPDLSIQARITALRSAGHADLLASRSAEGAELQPDVVLEPEQSLPPSARPDVEGAELQPEKMTFIPKPINAVYRKGVKTEEKVAMENTAAYCAGELKRIGLHAYAQSLEATGANPSYKQSASDKAGAMSSALADLCKNHSPPPRLFGSNKGNGDSPAFGIRLYGVEMNDQNVTTANGAVLNLASLSTDGFCKVEFNQDKKCLEMKFSDPSIAVELYKTVAGKLHEQQLNRIRTR